MAKVRRKSKDWVEDWLNSEGPSQGSRGKPRKKEGGAATSLHLDPAKTNGLVTEVFPNLCKVRLDDKNLDLLCAYRRARVVGKLKSEQRERSPVAVGDRVLVSQSGSSDGVIEGVGRRKNSLFRLAPGKAPKEGVIEKARVHVLSANIDCVAIVASAKDPEFSRNVVDRFLVAAEFEKVPVLIIVAKSDLLTSPGNLPHTQVDLQFRAETHLWDIYRELGYETLMVSTRSGDGVAELKERVKSKTVVFCGHSGVGKTSLLRVLLNQEVGRVQEISKANLTGKHTTTGAVLFFGPDFSKWIDTPGIREFGLTRISVDELKNLFPEMRDLKCGAVRCLHLDEENCSARSLERYPSYRQILISLMG